MRVTYNYPAKPQVPFPKKRARINGKLFFKYRQQFRNKTRHEEGVRRILSYPVPNLFAGRRPPTMPPSRSIRMMRYDRTISQVQNMQKDGSTV